MGEKVGGSDMGRLTEFFDYINGEKVADKERQAFRYNHLSITGDLKRIRRKRRADLRRVLVESKANNVI